MTTNKETAEKIVKKVSDAAIELAFTRHSLTTTDYEETDYPNIEEGVEAFKGLVEEVKADVLAVLIGDDTGCLDPEDIDYDTEAEFVSRELTTAQTELARAMIEAAEKETQDGDAAYDNGVMAAVDTIEKVARSRGIEVD